MKAVCGFSYGPPSELEVRDDVLPPTLGPNDVLVEVHASSINPGDLFSVLGQPWPIRLAMGMSKPRQPIPGRDLSGVVKTVGTAVTSFKPGDAVFGEIEGGAYAELVATPASSLTKLPAEVDFATAAAIPLAALTAYQGLTKSVKLLPGQSLLINGASGGVGTFAVQVGKLLGAKVTAVCSRRNVEIVQSLGADEVISYENEMFVERKKAFDVVFDLVGNHSISACRACLSDGGTYVASVGSMAWALKSALMSLVSFAFRTRVAVLAAQPNTADLEILGRWAADERLRPLVFKSVSLDDVPDALASQAKGHARGKTVVIVRD